MHSSFLQEILYFLLSSQSRKPEAILSWPGRDGLHDTFHAETICKINLADLSENKRT